MKKLYIFVFFFLFTLSAFSVEEVQFIEITSIQGAKNDGYSVGDTLSIYGEDLGTDTSNIKVFINDKKYTPNNAYGRQIEVKITKDMRSGQIYVQRTIKKDSSDSSSKDRVLESNRMDIDFKESTVNKIVAEASFYPGSQIELYGRNLNNAEFWCDDEALNYTKIEDTKATIVLPSMFLDCGLVVKKNGFEFDTKQNIEITPIPEFYLMTLKSDYIYLKGKGFEQYKNSLSKISIILDEDLTLSTPQYVSDTEIRFKRNKSIPYKGKAFLSVNGITLPAVDFLFMENMPYVFDVTEPSVYSKDEFIFDITVSESLASSSILVFFNGSELNEREDEDVSLENYRTLVIKRSSLPPKSGRIWVEKDGFKGKIYKYNFNYDFSPFISKVNTLKKLDQEGGKLQIEGENFFPFDSVKISSNAGKLEAYDLEKKSLTTILPHGIKDGEYYVSISNKYGTSGKIYFTVPSNTSKTFYPSPKILGVKYPEGPFFGKRIKITGESIYNITSINFSGKLYEVKWVNSSELGEVVADIPQSSQIEGKGEITITSNYKNDSNTIYYEFLEIPKKQMIKIIFPSNKEISVVQNNDEFQDVFSFDVSNNVRQGYLDLDFSLECEESCIQTFPFFDYQLINNNGEKQEDISILYDATSKTLSIKNLYIDSLITEKYTFQSKLPDFLYKDETRIINLKSAVLIDEYNDKYDVELEKDKKEILLQALEGSGICREMDENEKWSDCYSLDDEAEYEGIEEQIDDFYNIDGEETSKSENFVISIPEKDEDKSVNFNDIEEDEWFFPFVKDLYQRGIINGFAEGNFKPVGNLNRAELVKMVLVARGEEWGTYATVHFEDTATHWAKDLLEYSLEKGYIKMSQNFQPLKEVTRGETMKMLCKMFPSIEEKETDTHFTDLKDHWSKNCVMAAYDLGIIKGSSDTTFSPDDLITRAEFSKMLSKVIGNEE